MYIYIHIQALYSDTATPKRPASCCFLLTGFLVVFGLIHFLYVYILPYYREHVPLLLLLLLCHTPPPPPGGVLAGPGGGKVTKILIFRWTLVCQNMVMLGHETELYGVKQHSGATRRCRLASGHPGFALEPLSAGLGPDLKCSVWCA